MAKEITTEEKAAKKKKAANFVVNIEAEAIRGTEIMRSGEYKYARVSAKTGDDEYVSVTFEWKGEGYIPDAVMALMEYIKASKEDITEDAEEYKEISERLYK